MLVVVDGSLNRLVRKLLLTGINTIPQAVLSSLGKLNLNGVLGSPLRSTHLEQRRFDSVDIGVLDLFGYCHVLIPTFWNLRDAGFLKDFLIVENTHHWRSGYQCRITSAIDYAAGIGYAVRIIVHPRCVIQLL